MPASITHHVAVNLGRPCIDAALKVVQVFKPRVRQIHRRMQAADTVMAIHHKRHIIRQLVLPQRNQIHRDMQRIWQRTNRRFLIRTHVQQTKHPPFVHPRLQFRRPKLHDIHRKNPKKPSKMPSEAPNPLSDGMTCQHLKNRNRQTDRHPYHPNAPPRYRTAPSLQTHRPCA